MNLALRLLFLVAGAVALYFVVDDVDFAQVGEQLARLGFGIVPILAVGGLVFLAEILGWFAILRLSAPAPSALMRLWDIWLIGTAYSQIVPVVGAAGAPLKAIGIKRYFAVDYRTGATSLVAHETVFFFALLLVSAGFYAWAALRGELSAALDAALLPGLAAYAAMVAMVFLVQRLRIASRLLALWTNRRPAPRLAASLANIRRVEDDLIRFYAGGSRRLAAAFVLAVLSLLAGGLEVWLAAQMLGHPMGFWVCVGIVASVEIVRIATFFVPLSLGAQEAATVFVVTALGGSPAFGVSLAIVRRFRELVFIAWGVAISWRYALAAPAAAEIEADRAAGPARPPD